VTTAPFSGKQVHDSRQLDGEGGFDLSWMRRLRQLQIAFDRQLDGHRQ
jgi:hypothetical protein